VKSEKNTTVLEKSPHLEEIPDWLKESVQSEEKSDITETVSEGLEVPVPQETISQEKQNTTPSKS
jgi:hypothetical protein